MANVSLDDVPIRLLVFVLYQNSATLNVLVRGRGLRMLALAGQVAGLGVLVTGAVLGIMWSIFYCYRRALDAPGLLEKVLWGIWPGAWLAAGASLIVFGVARLLRRTLSDYKYLRPTKDLPDIITRSRVADVWRSLELAQSRRLFVERLVSVRKVGASGLVPLHTLAMIGPQPNWRGWTSAGGEAAGRDPVRLKGAIALGRADR